jgi:uncharacterized protein (TIGR02453 family)
LCHFDRANEVSERRNLWNWALEFVAEDPQIPRLASLARDDILTGLVGRARHHAISEAEIQSGCYPKPAGQEFPAEEELVAGKKHFDREFFEFLEELKENNTREWFQSNKERYRSVVQEPLLRFISDIADPLQEISGEFVADPRPSGGSMFRIYRDVRFAKDKSPYKTHASAQFRHRAGRDAHAPAFYLHLEPGNVFVGAGSWHPGREALASIRTAIAEKPDEWMAVLEDGTFSKRHRLVGDSLKRAPRGFDPGHPMIDELKRKDFISIEEFSQRTACSAGFIDLVAVSFAAAAPLVRFLTEAVGQEF